MITKERLKELVKQKATIWADDYGEIQLCNESEVCNTVAFTGNHQIQEGYCLSGFIYNDEFISDNIEPDGLEEDVEKGKWNYEMHASRLERFEPPVWEEMTKEPRCFNCWTKEFVVMDNDKPIGTAFIGVDFECEIVSVEMGSNKYFVEPLTKNNYTKACEMARTIFLGGTYEKIN